jgi:hypothetical protein
VVLVSFALVVVAAITLVIGLLQSGLGIIYVSIACSVLAGIVLFVAVLRGRPEPRAAGAPPAARPAPVGAPPPSSTPADTSWQPSTPAPAPAPVGARGDADAEAESAAPPPPPPPPPPSRRRDREPLLARRRSGAGAAADAGVGDRTEQLDQAAIEDAVSLDEPAPVTDGFPIHDYDRLRATEILPMLADLDDEQLAAVRSREESGKNRFMILSRIDDEVQARSSETWEVEEDQWEGEPEPSAEPVAEPVDAGGPGPVPVSRRRAATGEFPIADYDSLRALDVLGRLNDLSPAELQQVREREQSGDRRAMVLNRIDRILEETGPLPAEPLIVPPPEPTPARGRGRKKAAPPVVKKAAGRAARAAKGTRATKATKAVRVVAPPEPDAAPAVKKAAGAKKARVKKVAVAAPPIPTKRAGVKRGAAAGAGPESAAPAKRAGKAGAVKKTVAAKKAVAAKAVKAAKATKVPGAVKKGVRKR